MLGIFAKAPVPGRVKTRLAADIGAEEAADWYARAIRVVFQRSAKAWRGAERVLFFDPPDAEAVFAAMPCVPQQRVAQVPGDLGARMCAAFDYCFERGADRPVLIGSDAPTLPMERVGKAWQALAANDLVLGPATDGGYYLIGLRRRCPELFADVAWSTDTVLDTTQARAARSGLTTHLLDVWSDVDTGADLEALGPEWERAG